MRLRWIVLGIFILMLVISVLVQGQSVNNEVYARDILNQIEVGDLSIGNAYNTTVVLGAISISNSSINESIDLRNVIFNGIVVFDEIEFKNDVDFNECQFKENTYFYKSKFKGNVSFSNSKFDKIADFSGCEFGEHTSFWKVKFIGYTLFPKSHFNKTVDFSKVIFDQDNYFIGSTFDEESDFRWTKFSKNSTFIEARFNHNVYFNKSKFMGNVDFGQSRFLENAYFEGVQFEGDAIFYRTKINGIFDARQMKFNNFQIYWHSIEKNLVCDEDVYLALIEQFRKRGRFEDADDCYYQYRRWRQQQLPLLSASKFLDILAWLSCGYGVRCQFTILSGMGIMILFGFYFSLKNGVLKSNKFEIRSKLRDGFLFSAIILISAPTDWFIHLSSEYKYINMIKVNMYSILLERLVGWGLLILLLNTLIRIMIRY